MFISTFDSLWLLIVGLRYCAVAFSLITSDRNTPEQNFLYCREACQIPETIKQEALQLHPVLESCGACKVSHTSKFLKEKPFKYSPLKLPS